MHFYHLNAPVVTCFVCYSGLSYFKFISTFEDINKVAYHVYTGGNAVEIKTEADSSHSTDMTECSYDDKPSTGMFGIFWL